MIASQIAQMLVEARERKKLSVEDVSRALSFRAHVIQNLEAGAFERLGALLYVRSYLRKYGTFLGIDSEQLELLIAQLKELPVNDLTAYMEASKEADPKRLATRPLFKWYLIGITLAIILGIGAYFCLSESILETFSTEPQRLLPKENQAAANVDQYVENPRRSGLTVGENDAVTQVSNAAQIQEILDKVEQRQPDQEEEMLEDNQALGNRALLADNKSALAITVRDVCWTNVRDAEGRVVISENLSPNQIYHLNGVAPFTIRFGNAQAISKVTIDGQEVDEKKYRPQKNTTVIQFKVEPKENIN